MEIYQYLILRHLTLDEQTILSMKAIRMGYELSFEELGVSTIITVLKDVTNK